MAGRRVAITGPGGRLGRALVASFTTAGWDVLGWGRPAYDLDDPSAAERHVGRDRPEIVVHAAAWTDVDGCARDAQLAQRRNAIAVEELATSCVSHRVDLVIISTNEVFDGWRKTGRGYVETDRTRPINAYGASKLDGEAAARRAFAGASTPRLWIVRTSWLYGPPGNDFPSKIIGAADRLAPGEALRVVGDEIGSPTYAVDLADGILGLVKAGTPGLYHLTNAGRSSRLEWAAHVLARCRPRVPIDPIRQRDYPRPSSPPPWGVLACGRAARQGVKLRSWRDALDDYLDALCPAR